MLHTKANVLEKGVDAKEGLLEAVVGSTNVLDRMGDSIDQSGWSLKNFKKNPVILWGHNRKEEMPPIGKATRVWVEDKGEKAAKLMFKVQFDLQDNFAAEIFRKIKDGFINTVSVGFQPVEWEDIGEGPFDGRKYLKQELLELSFVPVPANPEAVIALKEMKDPRFNPIELGSLYPTKEVKKTKKVKKVKEVKEVKKVKEVKDVKKKLKRSKLNKKEKKEEVSVSTGDINGTTPSISVTKPEKKKVKEEEPVKEEKIKGTLPYKDLDTLPESASWDGPGEIAKAEVTDLKLMCTWFDSEKPDSKSSYKLPHHNAEGHKAVWRGVAAAMASLLGARGGVNVPEEGRKGVYNHLKKHYKQFDKDIPDFKAVEEQILKDFDEEIHALILDREDRYNIRLIKKVLKEQKETKKVKEVKATKERTPSQIEDALKIIDLALSKYKVDSREGGEKKG